MYLASGIVGKSEKSFAMSQLKTVILSGELGRKYGRRHRFAIESPAEAVRALCANFKDFKTHLIESDKRGVGYRVLVGGADQKPEDFHHPSSRAEIRIVPVIGGRKSGIWQVVAGAALIAASFFIPGGEIVAGLTYSSLAFSVGVSLALGGVAQMLAPQPKTSAGKNQASYEFSGPVNTTAQGVPVPVGYGRLIVGSAVVSAGITVDQVPTTQTGPTNLSATVTYNGTGYTLYASWQPAGLAIGYDVTIQSGSYGPTTLPRTNADSILATVPDYGPFSVIVQPVESDGSYGTAAACVSVNG